MKKIALLAACVAAFSLSMLAGCASAPQSAERVQAAIAKACPVVQVAVDGIGAIATLPAPVLADLQQVGPVVDQVCAGNATLDTSTILSLVTTGFPALSADIAATDLPADTKTKVMTGIAAAQIALTAVLQLAPAPAAQ
jgi:hypothetical protein